jgi:hypothetical protein
MATDFKKVTIAITVTPTQAVWLRVAAARCELSVSEFVRNLLDAAFGEGCEFPQRSADDLMADVAGIHPASLGARVPLLDVSVKP